MSDDGDLIEKTNHVGWPSGDNDNNDVVCWHLLVFKRYIIFSIIIIYMIYDGVVCRHVG